MSKLNSFKWIILLLGILMILVLVRNSDSHVFKEEVQKAVAASSDHSNLITTAQLVKLTDPFLIVYLGVKSEKDSLHLKPSVQISFDKLLDPVNRKILNEAKGAIILKSDSEPSASRAWVILNQLGYRKLWILSPEGNPEELKFKFQPDTTARLENDSI